MKKITFLLLLVSTACFSQKKFSTYLGLGMGGVIENRNTIPNCTAKGSPRVSAFLSQYYQVDANVSLGLQVLTSGDLIPTTKCSQYIASTNTRVLSPNSITANNFLIKGKYLFHTTNNIKPYVDLGIGITTYSRGYILNETATGLSKSRFALSSEIGIEVMKKFNFSCIAIFGGKTPAFSGFDSFSGENKVLQSISSQQIYLTVGYRLLRF